MARYSTVLEANFVNILFETNRVFLVYIDYAKSNDLFAVGVYLVALVAAQTTNIGTFGFPAGEIPEISANLPLGGSVWLKNWAEANGRAGGNPDVGKYIGIYFAFGIGASLLTVAQTLILWIFCSIEVSRSPEP